MTPGILWHLIAAKILKRRLARTQEVLDRAELEQQIAHHEDRAKRK